MHSFTLDKYASTIFAVNDSGLKKGDVSKPFLYLSHNVEDGLSLSVTLGGITPEDLETLAADLRAALAKYDRLKAPTEETVA